MHMNTRWKPSVTVAAIIERDGRFLLVEEAHARRACGSTTRPATWTRANRPSRAARARRWRKPPTASRPRICWASTCRASSARRPRAACEDITYLRFAFAGELGAVVPGRQLDSGIVRTLWLTPRRSARQRRTASQPAGAALHGRPPARPTLSARAHLHRRHGAAVAPLSRPPAQRDTLTQGVAGAPASQVVQEHGRPRALHCRRNDRPNAASR